MDRNSDFVANVTVPGEHGGGGGGHGVTGDGTRDGGTRDGGGRSGDADLDADPSPTATAPVGVFLPRAAKGAEITLFPTSPCGATARFTGNDGDSSGDSSGGARPGDSKSGGAEPIDGQCHVDLAMDAARSDLLNRGARFSIFAAPGDAIQEWRDTPAPTQAPQFHVYDEEWAVGCLGLSSELWECFSLVPSRRDRAGGGIETAPGWSSDRHAEVLIEKRLQRGEIDWDSEVPLCDVPVFDAAAEARAHPGRPLHELFSERYRRDGAQSPVLILNDPADAEFEAMDHGIRPDQIESDESPGGFLFRGSKFSEMKRARITSRFQKSVYRKDFLRDVPDEVLKMTAFPAFPDPVSLRDPLIQPHVNVLTGARESRHFFDRNTYRFGGSGTSTSFHAHRAAWLRLHGGTKVWFFHPPKSTVAPRAMFDFKFLGRYPTCYMFISWLLLRDELGKGGVSYPMLNFTYAQGLRDGTPPKVCIQRAGTFMYVGDDWMHAVVNVGLTAGTTAFSQVSYHAKPVDQINEDLYYAEYPTPGHTSRSMPDS
jgi:hypothetical protein